MLIFKASH